MEMAWHIHKDCAPISVRSLVLLPLVANRGLSHATEWQATLPLTSPEWF